LRKTGLLGSKHYDKSGDFFRRSHFSDGLMMPQKIIDAGMVLLDEFVPIAPVKYNGTG